MPKQNLTDEQAKFIDGLRDCVDLHNDLVRRLTATGLKVEHLCYSDGQLSVEVIKDVRTVEIKFGHGHD